MAPIALFVYNRPHHTLQTLEALAANELADQSLLYIFADGAKGSVETDAAVLETRKIINSRKWCREVKIIESSSNKGLANSIVDGVTEVLKRHGKVIVLEDDLVTSKGFLRFMNDGLNAYELEKRVMHISGYSFPVKEKLPTTFFYRQTSCWGWATWEDRWNKLERSAPTLYHDLEQTGKIKTADIDGTNQFIQQLKLNMEGVIKTWAVFWHFSVFLNDGLSLHPGKSLVRNIGMDSSGTNCVDTNAFEVDLASYVPVRKIKIEDYKKIYKYLRRFYKKEKNNSYLSLAKKTIRRMTSPALWHKVKMQKNKGYREFYNEEQRVKSLPRYTETDTIFSGKKIRIADNASFWFLKKELFDQQIYNFRTASTEPYIIDCGANIGLSVIYFKSLYPQSKIVAFEPDEKIFDILNFNLGSFELSDVQVIKKACWSEETTLQFFSEGADGGRKAKDTDSSDIISVETTRLAPYLNRKVDFLKIDIEGAEYEVIKDIEPVLGNVEHIFVEFHSFVNEEQKLPEILNILKGAGFRMHITAPGLASTSPFIHLNTHSRMDNQLNIYGFRDKQLNTTRA